MAVFHAVRVYPGSLAWSMRLLFHKPVTTTVHRFLSEEAATSKRRIDLRGIFPPIVTTFGPQGELAEREVPGNVARWLREPLRGLVVQGSNGESVLLTEEERVAIVHTVRACLPLDRLLIAGSGCEGTLQTLEMTKKMADAGADAVLVVTPAYYRGRMTIGAFVNHYTQVANDSPVPVILYSVPGNTALELPIEAVVTLAQHPNIIGMKDSGGDISRIATIIHATQKEDFQMLAGSASFLFAAYAVGAVGGICGLANVLPGPLCKLDDAWWHGNIAEARELQLRLLRPNAAVTRRFSVPGVKQAMEWFGFHGGPCRPPLQALSPIEASMLRQEFVADGWLTN